MLFKGSKYDEGTSNIINNCMVLQKVRKVANYHSIISNEEKIFIINSVKQLNISVGKNLLSCRYLSISYILRRILILLGKFSYASQKPTLYYIFYCYGNKVQHIKKKENCHLSNLCTLV